ARWDLRPRVDGPVRLLHRHVGMMTPDVTAGEAAQGDVLVARRDRHLPQPLGTGQRRVLTVLALLAAQHAQERRLRDDLDVCPRLVQLLRLGVLVTLLALAQKRRALVANDEIVELL